MVATVRLISNVYQPSLLGDTRCQACLNPQQSETIFLLGGRSDAYTARGLRPLRCTPHVAWNGAGSWTSSQVKTRCQSLRGSSLSEGAGSNGSLSNRSDIRFSWHPPLSAPSWLVRRIARSGHGLVSRALSPSSSLRRLTPVQASESNATVERPAVKSPKEEIYKGLVDSPVKVERCIIVDEENNVVGEATRAETVGQRLWGRGVYCLVQNKRGQLLVTQRTEEKDLYPGHLDVVVSGCVNVGEEYQDTIIRELSEELGLKSVDRSSLTPLFLFKWVDEFCRIWGCAYHYVTDCETFDLQVEEVQWCKWMDMDEVEKLIQTARFTPVGLSVLRRFLRERQLADS